MAQPIDCFPALAPSVPWFVALPDNAAAGATAARLAAPAPLTIAHASGLPWLMGAWPGGEATVARAGSVTLVALGHHAITPGRLQDVARRVARSADVERLTRSFAGSFHLLSSVDGDVRIQATALGLRAILPTAGRRHHDRGRPRRRAGRAAGRGPKRAGRLHLMWPPVLRPVSSRPLWRGVDAVDPFDCLLLGRDGCARTMRRWSPPEPSLPLAAAAAGLPRRCRRRWRTSSPGPVSG